VSSNEYSCAHNVTWRPKNFGDIPPYLTYADNPLVIDQKTDRLLDSRSQLLRKNIASWSAMDKELLSADQVLLEASVS
jgi:hypothetical protein